MSCGADTTANVLLASLTAGKDFDLPDVDLSDPKFQIPEYDDNSLYDVERLTNESLTTRVIGGDGVFDALMDGIGVHIRKEFEQNRITGSEYTKAYVGIVGGALQTAASYLLGREQAYWNAVAAKMQARAAEVAIIQARVQLETTKLQLEMVKIEAANAEANYGLTKLKLATEDQQYCMLKAQTDALIYQNTNILPAQFAGLKLDNDTKKYQVEQIMPTQRAGLILDNDTKKFQLDEILPEQLEGIEIDNDTKKYQVEVLMPVQKDLLQEQVEVQRAQTLDTRTDGTTVVVGSVGKQKDLYTQQIISYQRDAEVKATKLFTDAWITMKTIDEGLEPPGAFTNASLNIMLKNIKKNNNIETKPTDQFGTYNETREAVAGGNKPVVVVPDEDD